MGERRVVRCERTLRVNRKLIFVMAGLALGGLRAQTLDLSGYVTVGVKGDVKNTASIVVNVDSVGIANAIKGYVTTNGGISASMATNIAAAAASQIGTVDLARGLVSSDGAATLSISGTAQTMYELAAAASNAVAYRVTYSDAPTVVPEDALFVYAYTTNIVYAGNPTYFEDVYTNAESNVILHWQSISSLWTFDGNHPEISFYHVSSSRTVSVLELWTGDYEGGLISFDRVLIPTESAVSRGTLVTLTMLRQILPNYIDGWGYSDHTNWVEHAGLMTPDSVSNIIQNATIDAAHLTGTLPNGVLGANSDRVVNSLSAASALTGGVVVATGPNGFVGSAYNLTNWPVYTPFTGVVTPASGTATVAVAVGAMPSLTITSPTVIQLDPTGFPTTGVCRVSLNFYSGTNAVTFATNVVTYATTPTVSTSCWNTVLFRRTVNCIWRGVGL